MNRKLCAPADRARSWESIDWKKAEAYVKKLQMRIVKAQKDGHYSKVKTLQWLLTHSFYDRLEPYDGKLSRTVLRGGAGSNASLLPDIHSEKDILKLVTTLIANTKGEGKVGDDFWVKAETLLYCAYATLDAQYEKEQSELTAEISVLEKAVKSYEKHEKDADRFIALIDKYENFDKLTIAMLNEFIEKILVHERDRKGSIQTTQEVEIYFNFVGRFVPPAFGEVELTPEELEEIRKREERKDRLHQNYLKRKASGAQKRYEDKIKKRKKAEIEAKKAAIRAEDIAKGVFVPVSSLPQREPMKGVQTA